MTTQLYQDHTRRSDTLRITVEYVYLHRVHPHENVTDKGKECRSCRDHQTKDAKGSLCDFWENGKSNGKRNDTVWQKGKVCLVVVDWR
jgi:hypothetical protein